MSFYDIVMLVVLIGAIGFGYWKGLAWQIASVSALVVSYLVAVNFKEQVAQFIQAAEPLNKIGAMLILFVGCSLVIWMVYAWVTKSMEKMELKGFNRQMGALVGGVTGVLLCMAITMFSVSLLGDQAHEAIHDSRMGPYVVKGIQQVHDVLPPEIAARFDDYIHHFEDEIGHQLDEAPTGYQLFPTRQADGNNGVVDGYQGGWQSNPTTGGEFDNTYLPAQPIQTRFRQPSLSTNTSANSQTTSPINISLTPQPQENGLQPPKLQINVDSKSILKRILGSQ